MSEKSTQRRKIDHFSFWKFGIPKISRWKNAHVLSDPETGDENQKGCPHLQIWHGIWPAKGYYPPFYRNELNALGNNRERVLPPWQPGRQGGARFRVLGPIHPVVVWKDKEIPSGTKYRSVTIITRTIGRNFILASVWVGSHHLCLSCTPLPKNWYPPPFPPPFPVCCAEIFLWQILDEWSEPRSARPSN